MKYIPITVISVLSSSLVMALIVVPIIGTQSYKIRNLFFFFFIPIVLFGIINFITYSFLSKFQFDKYLNLCIKALASIAIAFIIYKTVLQQKLKKVYQQVLLYMSC